MINTTIISSTSENPFWSFILITAGCLSSDIVGLPATPAISYTIRVPQLAILGLFKYRIFKSLREVSHSAHAPNQCPIKLTGRQIQIEVRVERWCFHEASDQTKKGR